MTLPDPLAEGWLCTTVDLNFSLSVTRPGGAPVIYRIGQGLVPGGLQLVRHERADRCLIALHLGERLEIATGVWLTPGRHTPSRTLCVHAAPEARTQRRWHFIETSKET